MAYHQLVVRESSRFITTFYTHAGLFRYKRLHFGISSASENLSEYNSPSLAWYSRRQKHL